MLSFVAMSAELHTWLPATRIHRLTVLTLIGILARILAFFYVQQNSNIRDQNLYVFLPDEATYSRMNEWFYKGANLSDFVPGWSIDLYLQSRIQVWISYMFMRMDFDALVSGRLTSLFCSVASLLVVRKIIFVIARSNLKQTESKTSIFAFSCFAFMPSNILWGALSIKEATTQLLLAVMTLVMFHAGSRSRKLSNNFLVGFCLFALLWLFFVQRHQVAYILSLVFAVLIFYLKGLNWLFRALLLGILAIVILAGLDALKNPIFESKTEITKSQSPAIPNAGIGQQNTSAILIPVNSAGKLVERRIVGTLDAESVYENPPCLGIESLYKEALTNSELLPEIFCGVVDLPIQLFNYWLRPLIFLDNSSPFQILASIENLFWFFIIFSILKITVSEGKYKSILLKGRQRELVGEYFCVITLFLFSVGSALYESNQGTAYRHRSVVLCTLLVIYLTLGNKASSKFLRSIKKPIQ